MAAAKDFTATVQKYIDDVSNLAVPVTVAVSGAAKTTVDAVQTVKTDNSGTLESKLKNLPWWVWMLVALVILFLLWKLI